MTLSVKQEAEWMQILRADIAATGSISKTAIRVGIARSGLSAIINATASSPYANGKASTAKVAERVMNTIGLVACPFLSEYHGAEQRITGLQCREYAYRENPPTSAPREMQHWRSCQGCEKRVKPAASIPIQIKPRAQPSARPVAFGGKAGSGDEAYQEGWDCIGGPTDNPYPTEDARSDYWDTGFKQRRDFDRKERARINKLGAESQQAGIIDKVTLPLPEVGAPQIAATAIQAAPFTFNG